MKWIAGTLGGVFLGFAILMAVIAFRSGMLLPTEVAFHPEPLGPYNTLYKEVVGPYHEVASHIIEIEDFVKSKGVICIRTFGQYLDDPQSVDHERLRSHVGCLFDPAEDLSFVINSQEYKDKNLRNGRIEMPSYIEGRFEGSPAMVAFKVYPKIFKFAEQKQLNIAEQTALEIYEVKSNSKVLTRVIFYSVANP